MSFMHDDDETSLCTARPTLTSYLLQELCDTMTRGALALLAVAVMLLSLTQTAEAAIALSAFHNYRLIN